MDLTLFLAITGNFVGGLALVHDIYATFRDSGKLKISLSIKYVAGAERTEPPYIYISIVNTGRRDMTLSCVEGITKKSWNRKKERRAIYINPLMNINGKRLKEGESINLNPIPITKECKDYFSKYKFFEVVDTRNTSFRVPRKELKLFQSELKRA